MIRPNLEWFRGGFAIARVTSTVSNDIEFYLSATFFSSAGTVCSPGLTSAWTHTSSRYAQGHPVPIEKTLSGADFSDESLETTEFH